MSLPICSSATGQIRTNKTCVGSNGITCGINGSQGMLAKTLEPSISVFAMAVSSNGNYLAVGGPDTVVVWDLRTDEKLHTLRGHEYVVLGVAFSPNNRLLASSWEGQQNLFMGCAQR